MKYYSDDTVKGLLEQLDSHFVKYLDSLPFIEIKKPHGRLIDADELEEYYDCLEADNGVYMEEAGETLETINNAPTVLEAST